MCYLQKIKKFILSYNEGNYEQMQLLFNRLTYFMMQSINIYLGHLKPTINSTVRPSLGDLLSLKYVKNIDYGNYIFKQTTSMFITNIIKLITKFVLLHHSPSKMMSKWIKNVWKYVNNKIKTNVSIPQLCKPNTNKKVFSEIHYNKVEGLASPFNSVLLSKEKIHGILSKRLYLIATLISVLMLQP